MQNTKHTPGPWNYSPETNRKSASIVRQDLGLTIAEVYGNGQDERASTARLISAAPELLEACKALKLWNADVPVVFSIPDKMIARISKAILKAEGGGK